MKRFTMFACLALALAFAFASFAADMPRYVAGNGTEVIIGGGQSFAKASRDTALIIGPNGSGAAINGQFQTAGGNASWNGWTHYDITQPTQIRWQASTYFAVTGTYSAWCGEDIPSCDAGATDPDGGYANNYNEMLEWRGAVANNTLSCTVTVTANLQHDTEPGYDYTWLSCEKFDQGILNINSWDGAGLVAVNESFSYAPGDYMGGGSNEVVVLFRVTSDGGWSDGDCSWPTSGACQLDDVSIALTNGTGYSFDFEDGTLGAFTVRFPLGVGDFAKVWTGLEDVDPCNTNYSPQVAFIDDGVVVPGTGGTLCVNWCYGPSGFIVNTTGGLAGADSHLNNAVESPVGAWVNQAYDGANLVFDAYRHEDLSPDAPGIFYTWGVRSVAAGGDITTAGWQDRNFVYYGGPDYLRVVQACGDLLEPGRTEVQVQFAAYELGWVSGWNGNDGYPAPYFDNVRFETFPIVGPGMSTREIDLAQDNFPAIGQVDLVNLGNNSVRFDMANNISLITHQLNDPGDSVVFTAVPSRAGAVLAGLPRCYYNLQANPVFDAYRTSGLPNQGYVDCVEVYNSQGVRVADTFSADLPDTGFLFPGDILHYYLQAGDDLGGDVQYATLPADTAGFSVFSAVDPLTYSSSFTVRALPTIAADLSQPSVLFWNDFANRGGQAEWHGALANLGMLAGRDYDVYYTNGPSSGVGNGLGGRATVFHIENYSDILYTSGDLSINTIANGDYNSDPSKDAELLATWMTTYGGDIFLTGDDLASDLNGAGTTTLNFLTDQMGVAVASNDIRPLIGSQTAPRVLVEAGNPVFATVDSWIAYGGCGVINTFDAVSPVGGATRIAQFANAAGNPGGYPYAAAILNDLGAAGRAVSMPYDLMFVYTDPNEGAKADAQLSARARVLNDVLNYFGIAGNPGDATAVPGAEVFAARNFPNPFNPKTTISYTVAKPGHMTLKVFNVRGELVKTLIDGYVDASSSIDWDGSNNAGAKVSSGVYFYEARMGNDVVVNKMALVK
ncbi:MAG TPA: T9SS type A sorting domain-containing protein [Candidatus Krumholzibacteria bacterium]|nr:T9SS type A sorting domain-containing protein [Candidatus Krumholzibacteria bacterium]